MEGPKMIMNTSYLTKKKINLSCLFLFLLLTSCVGSRSSKQREQENIQSKEDGIIAVSTVLPTKRYKYANAKLSDGVKIILTQKGLTKEYLEIFRAFREAKNNEREILADDVCSFLELCTINKKRNQHAPFAISKAEIEFLLGKPDKIEKLGFIYIITQNGSMGKDLTLIYKDGFLLDFCKGNFIK
jgi:hypothetical protein